MSFLFGSAASLDCQLVELPLLSFQRMLMPSAVPEKSAVGVKAT